MSNAEEFRESDEEEAGDHNVELPADDLGLDDQDDEDIPVCPGFINELVDGEITLTHKVKVGDRVFMKNCDKRIIVTILTDRGVFTTLDNREPIDYVRLYKTAQM